MFWEEVHNSSNDHESGLHAAGLHICTDVC